MPPEIHRFTLAGAPLRAHLAHDEVVALLAAAGLPLPAIPPGFNTARAHLTLPTGEPALYSAQRGFAPLAADDEREINGALLLVLEDAAWAPADAARILDLALQKILDS